MKQSKQPVADSPERDMMKLILGKWISKPVYVAARLGIPDLLRTGAKSVTELAELTKTDGDTLYRMMRALASTGIFADTGDRKFANTPLSETLARGRLRSASLMFLSPWHDRMWENLLYTIQTGKPAFEKTYGTSAFHWLRDHPEEREIFHETNSYQSALSLRAVAEVYDFSDIKTVTDAGGGTGSVLMEILKSNPGVSGTLAELPEVIALFEKIEKEKSIETRIRAVECDFFKGIPGGSDLYLLSHILHDWPDEQCTVILDNCRAAMGSGGRLLILEAVVPAGNEFSTAKLLDLEVLLMGGGRERTEEEFRTLLAKSGFSLTRVMETNGDVSVLECVPEQRSSD